MNASDAPAAATFVGIVLAAAGVSAAWAPHLESRWLCAGLTLFAAAWGVALGWAQYWSSREELLFLDWLVVSGACLAALSTIGRPAFGRRWVARSLPVLVVSGLSLLVGLVLRGFAEDPLM